MVWRLVEGGPKTDRTLYTVMEREQKYPTPYRIQNFVTAIV